MPGCSSTKDPASARGQQPADTFPGSPGAVRASVPPFPHVMLEPIPAVPRSAPPNVPMHRTVSERPPRNVSAPAGGLRGRRREENLDGLNGAFEIDSSTSYYAGTRDRLTRDKGKGTRE